MVGGSGIVSEVWHRSLSLLQTPPHALMCVLVDGSGFPPGGAVQPQGQWIRYLWRPFTDQNTDETVACQPVLRGPPASR